MSGPIEGAIRAASMGVYLEPTVGWLEQFEYCVRRNVGLIDELVRVAIQGSRRDQQTELGEWSA